MQKINSYLKKIKLPNKDSHKGQNGKLLIIGGSELFHAASKWSLDIASKFVDMVFYSSVPENNELILEAKGKFWNGIVVERKNLDSYIKEADCVLIGPGMMRVGETQKMINDLLVRFPDKKIVIDAGALQMVDVRLLNKNHILTPHGKEMMGLEEKLAAVEENKLTDFGATVLLKGKADQVLFKDEKIEIEGGNAGMTKGGTGDVLSGLVAALYCGHDALTSAIVGSHINKKAGDFLYKKVGPFFNSSDLVGVIPEVFWKELNKQ
jgi:hydroxyethylthiazole kinase-like uncharacterized protein yjeF